MRVADVAKAGAAHQLPQLLIVGSKRIALFVAPRCQGLLDVSLQMTGSTEGRWRILQQIWRLLTDRQQSRKMGFLQRLQPYTIIF